MMTQIAACVGKVLFPPPLSAQTVLRGKPSTHVVPGYPGRAAAAMATCSLAPGPRSEGSEDNRRRPAHLQTWGTQVTWQCPGKKALTQHARCGTFLSFLPVMACT